MAKKFATDTAMQVCTDCVQLMADTGTVMSSRSSG